MVAPRAGLPGAARDAPRQVSATAPSRPEAPGEQRGRREDYRPRGLILLSGKLMAHFLLISGKEGADHNLRQGARQSPCPGRKDGRPKEASITSQFGHLPCDGAM
ncbi:unnamed protein product [Bubo scandiacus]